jgi:hypothetical protein
MASDKVIEKWLPFFHRAGFQEFDIDFAHVSDETVQILGEVLQKREKVRDLRRKLARVSAQPAPEMPFPLEVLTPLPYKEIK